MFKKYFSLNNLSTLLLYTSILIFIIAFNFTDNRSGGWNQQFLPDLNGRPLADMQFIDSLVGYGITGDNTVGDTNFIIKTTNGGDNWVIVHTIYRDLSSIKFLNQNTGFVCGGFNSVQGIVIKTTDGGKNWVTLSTPFANRFDDMSVLNEDTILVVDDNGFNGGVFRTTNGGTNWSLISVDSRKKIYMLNGNVGFSCDKFRLSKTTNGGFNWSIIPGEDGFQDINFIDSNTGWKANGDMKKTTDGGLNWIEQTLPTTTIIGIGTFENINHDTIWSVGGSIFYQGHGFSGIIYKTTNGGKIWGYQIPDTSYFIPIFYHTDFVDKSNGWSYFTLKGVHTVSGGDTLTHYTGIKNIYLDNAKTFQLFQNYPNPFNPVTIINYELRIPAQTRLIIYDISGKEIKELINKKQSSGTYNIKFDGSNIPSGVYFYKLEAEDVKGNIFSETKKMILLR